MNPYQKDVQDFMKLMGQEAPEKPLRNLKDYPFALRARLMLEEAYEFGVATGPHGDMPNTPNHAEMIDAICDLLYVTFGAAVAMGLDLDPFWQEVHRANMAKVGGPIREDGKKLRPPGWTPPDVAGRLAEVLLESAYQDAATWLEDANKEPKCQQGAQVRVIEPPKILTWSKELVCCVCTAKLEVNANDLELSTSPNFGPLALYQCPCCGALNNASIEAHDAVVLMQQAQRRPPCDGED